ncbi:MAG: aryl-sulfate sulfotransferase [Chitinophagales bacterium]|nr:aryl-sulfate sulfotransferase [Chitinophagales bacterium]
MKHFFTSLVLILICRIVLGQFSYVYPVPGSALHTPQTTILLKNGDLIDRQSLVNEQLVEISGSLSGVHEWTCRLSDDDKTVIIKPDQVFAYGETVSVTVFAALRKQNGESINGTSFNFKIKNEVTPAQQEKIKQAKLQNFIDSYGYDPTKNNSNKLYPLDSMPTWTVNINDNPAPGMFFFTNHEEGISGSPETNSFTTIIKNNGQIVWARDQGPDGRDFKINANGYLTYYKLDPPSWMVMDSNYNIIDSVQCKNGLADETNSHDMMMYPDGHVFLIAWENQTIDMTAYGGVEDAIVTGLIIQEQDANRDVVFEWRSWDHFEFTDANDYTPLTNATVDYVHGNSVERDYDGNVLISSRNMDELTKINHQTGNIIWRMGGENNQFTFINDNIPTHFSSQHDLRRIPNGNITIFNNGNHPSPPISSAKEYALNEVNKIATLVWYYEHPDVNGVNVYGSATGSVQRLPSGNTVINWGLVAPNLPNHTEVDMSKNIKWEMSFDEPGQKTYRIHKYAWNPCSRITGYLMKAKPGSSMALVGWGTATGAISYQVQYRKLGTSMWQSVNTAKLSVKLTGLIPETKYEWRVKTLCSKTPTISSAYSELDTFKTDPLRTSNELMDNANLLSLYPVPAHDQLTIQLNESCEGSLLITNMIGRVMYESTLRQESGGSIKLDIKNWSPGAYIVQLRGNENIEVKKFIKE